MSLAVQEFEQSLSYRVRDALPGCSRRSANAPIRECLPKALRDRQVCVMVGLPLIHKQCGHNLRTGQGACCSQDYFHDQGVRHLDEIIR